MKRDEIYSFLGGLFIALPWFIFADLKYTIGDNNSLGLALIVFLWLLATAISAIVPQVLLTLLLTAIARCRLSKCADKEKAIRNKLHINAESEEPIYIKREYFEETLIMSQHVNLIIFSSLTHASIPVYFIYDSYQESITVCPTFVTIFIALVTVVLSIAIWLAYRSYWIILAIDDLRQKRRVTLYDANELARLSTLRLLSEANTAD